MELKSAQRSYLLQGLSHLLGLLSDQRPSNYQLASLRSCKGLWTVRPCPQPVGTPHSQQANQEACNGCKKLNIQDTNMLPDELQHGLWQHTTLLVSQNRIALILGNGQKTSSEDAIK